MTTKRKCPICKKQIIGRKGKKFCTPRCKADYHRRLAAHTHKATASIDKVLHRNRSILQEVLGKKLSKIKVPLIELESRKFNFTYITKYIVNKEGKEFRYIYDFSYMTFSDNTILIRKSRNVRKEYT